MEYSDENKDHITYERSFGKIDSSNFGYSCGWTLCNVWLPSLDALSVHVSKQHANAADDGLFYCGWMGCNRRERGFNARYKMLVHIRTHTNEKPHRCKLCNKSFSRAENLKIHSRSHTGERPYKCYVYGCGKAYSNSSDRFKHSRTHAVDKPYACKVVGCPKRYTDPSSLRKHVKTFKHDVDATDFDKNNSDVPLAENSLNYLQGNTFDRVPDLIYPLIVRNTYFNNNNNHEEEAPLDLTTK